jgi:selenocysteine lyase/cysteine desulfurase
LTIDWESLRAEFPALARWTCLNTATYGQVPLRAVAAAEQHWARRAELACSDFLDWYTDADRLRGSIARLIHASAADIAFVPNTSAALATVLSGLAPEPGTNVVTLDDEFPNYQYMRLARKVSWERFYDSVDDRTRLIALSEVNYSTGFRPPLAQIARFAREHRVPLFVDGSQSTGGLRFDVTQTPVDVLAVHGYKWLLSPTGAGFMYVSPEFRRRLPPAVVGWRSHRGWRNVDHLHHGMPEFKDAAEKYEGGGLPFTLLYAMEAVVNWMLDIGPDAIERRVLGLADATREILRRLGAFCEDTNSPIVTATWPGKDASALARALKERWVLVSARHGALRVSAHFYNNQQDLNSLEHALRSSL